MTIILNGSTGIDAPALTLDTPLADAEGGTGQVAAVPFKLQFTSAEQTITAAGGLTIPHGLGASPSLLQVKAICKTAEYNYSIGDEVLIGQSASATAAADGFGISVTFDTTNISIRFGSQTNPIRVLNKTTGDSQIATNANWKLIVRAWA